MYYLKQIYMAAPILMLTFQVSKVTEVKLFAEGDLISREFSPWLFDPKSPVLSCSHTELKPKEKMHFAIPASYLDGKWDTCAWNKLNDSTGILKEI